MAEATTVFELLANGDSDAPAILAPARPSLTLMSSIGCALGAQACQTPMAESNRLDASASA